MPRLSSVLLAAAALAAVPASAEQRRFPLTGFDRVVVAGSDDVTITRGGFAVTADGAAADLDRLDIAVVDGVLKISRKRGDWRSWNGKAVRVAVALPALRGLSLSGSADVQADRGDADRFALTLSGSGDVSLAKLDAKTADISLSGSGDVVTGGRCGAVNLRLSGSGNADLSALKCTNASISVAGSGDVRAHVAGAATVQVAGSGDVAIAGGARCTKRVAGSGTVTCS
ncbi:head GIN domain-containing protein [Sandarakinorhabdus rubra]|uniref:head GIN domain-containing protein n=1 Tax=Sandarakinorhabdus rubra TaxID=2672568 RepID=UPI0013DD1D1B|nr:head GIN domain-containing protein [Sandarakinorhabdus rubra]